MISNTIQRGVVEERWAFDLALVPLGTQGSFDKITLTRTLETKIERWTISHHILGRRGCSTRYGVHCHPIHDVLGGLLKELGQARNESELLSHLREIVFAGSIFQATTLELLLMGSLLRRGRLRQQALIVKISIVTPWIIAVTVTVRLRVIEVFRNNIKILMVIVGVTVPALATAACTFIRWRARRALIFWIGRSALILGILRRLLILLLIECLLISLVHVLLLVLRLVVRTWRRLVGWSTALILTVAITVILRWLLIASSNAWVVRGVIHLLVIVRVTSVVVVLPWNSILPVDSCPSRWLLWRWSMLRCLLL